MAKIAIVGTSHNLTENEERDIRQFIGIILQRHNPDSDVILSGGAKGVDSFVVEIAVSLGYKIKEYIPILQTWSSYKERNLKLAKDCDELYCLSIPVHDIPCYHHQPEQQHEKTAGCWTMNKALELGKDCQLIVIPTRRFDDQNYTTNCFTLKTVHGMASWKCLFCDAKLSNRAELSKHITEHKQKYRGYNDQN